MSEGQVVPGEVVDATPLLKVENLQVEFAIRDTVVKAVRGLSFELHPGETLGLVGESGSGKSTGALSLVNLLPAGIARVSGSASFRGRELIGMPDEELRRIRGAEIAMIFQDPLSSLNPVLTVGRQISEALERHLAMEPDQARQRSIELLDRVGIPNAKKRINDYPHQYSGGMRQRAMIAMAISCEPALLIADEPTTALDVTIQAQILALLDELRAQLGMAVILITHNLGVVAGFADSIGVMYAGAIAEIGSTQDVLANPLHPYTIGLLRSLPRLDRERQATLSSIGGAPPDLSTAIDGCAFAPRCRWRITACWQAIPHLDTPRAQSASEAGPRLVACHNQPTLPESQAGAPLRPGFVPAPRPGEVATAEPVVSGSIASTPSSRSGGPDGAVAPGQHLLEVDGLRVYFPSPGRGRLRRQSEWLRAVDGISFYIDQGETLGLVGESGSGKTTTGRAIVRIAEPMGGSIRLAGENLTSMHGEALRRKRQRFQMVFQDPYSSLDPRRSVGEILAEPIRVHGLASGSTIRDRVAQLLDMVGLDVAFVDRYPHQFSGGQRQRIGIARALAVQPDLIVCDEPVSGLDVSIQAQVINLLERIQSEIGVAYLFISHDLAVVRHVADHVAVMYLGRIVEIGPANALYTDARHPYTLALLSAEPIPEVQAERSRRRIILKGDIPSPADPPAGCRFHPRCWLRARLGNPEICVTADPPLVRPESGFPEHAVACHFSSEGPSATADDGKAA